MATDDSQHPAALVDGQPAEMQQAIEAAAEILTRADLPLVYGLGNSTTESQRAAIMLAEEIGGIVDSHTSLTHGPSKIAAQLVGKVTCTLGEVKNRADLVIYWSTNPIETHPRHLTKYTFTPRGRHVPRGGHDRTMLVVDVRETPSARAADRSFRFDRGSTSSCLRCSGRSSMITPSTGVSSTGAASSLPTWPSW
jgi:formylmethanofuran dehydrogenase subunit B